MDGAGIFTIIKKVGPVIGSNKDEKILDLGRKIIKIASGGVQYWRLNKYTFYNFRGISYHKKYFRKLLYINPSIVLWIFHIDFPY